jgi:hypothetical protein
LLNVILQKKKLQLNKPIAHRTTVTAELRRAARTASPAALRVLHPQTTDQSAAGHGEVLPFRRCARLAETTSTSRDRPARVSGRAVAKGRGDSNSKVGSKNCESKRIGKLWCSKLQMPIWMRSRARSDCPSLLLRCIALCLDQGLRIDVPGHRRKVDSPLRSPGPSSLFSSLILP